MRQQSAMTSFNLGNPSGEIGACELTIMTVISEAGHMSERCVECKRRNKKKRYYGNYRK